MKIRTFIKNLSNYKKFLHVEELTNTFLKKSSYLKLDLPVLSPALMPESYIEVFETEFRYFKERQKLYLTPSPELFLKRLLAYGIGDCYYLGKAFRNADPTAPLHSPEFTILEFYKTKASYMDIADVVLKLLQFISKQVNGSTSIIYQGKKVSFSKWEKLSVEQAFKKFAQVSAGIIFDKYKFIEIAKKKGYVTKGFSYEDVFSQIYVQEVEPHLGKNGYPTLLYDYPKEFAALAKLHKDGRTAERFEFYIEGIEIGDCYTELTNWKEQKKRFITEDCARKEQGKITHPIDKGFIEALQYGLTDCAGIAIGFERLALLYANVKKIEDLKLIIID